MNDDNSLLHRHLLILVGCFALLIIPLPLRGQIQMESGFTMPPLGNDTLCFRYHFLPQDSLVYSVESADSISFIGDPVLTKIRGEVLSIVCDSVTAEGHFLLKITLHQSVQRQKMGSDSVTVTTSPWIGRSVFLLVDSLGQRIDVRVDDASLAAVAPGGPFQPIPLPTLGESCGVQNQSWMVSDTTALVENGVPPASFAYSSLWRVIDVADTLDRRFHQIQYTQTALGRMVVKSGRVDIDQSVTIAAYGKLSMDSVLSIPFHLFATSDNRIEMVSGDGRTKKGRHRVATHYQLLEISSPHPERRYRLMP